MIALAFKIIGNIGDTEIPKVLSPRTHSIYGYITLYISIAFLLITFARISTAHFLISITKSLYKNRSVEKIALEEHPLSALSSFCLLANFLICGSCLLYLSVNYYFTTIHTATLYAIIYTPMLLLFGPYLFLSLVEAVSGEYGITHQIKLTNWVIYKFIGVLFSILLLFWVFNDKYASIFAQFLVIILCICYIYRLFRGIVFAFTKGISWYYIILYFCMFEIIPIYPLWMLLTGKI